MLDKFCVVRTQSAGVWVGKVKERDGQEVTLENAIRIWYWDGAASLSQLAMEGVKNIKDSKFAMPVDEVLLLQVIEIIPCSPQALRNIYEEVKSWKK